MEIDVLFESSQCTVRIHLWTSFRLSIEVVTFAIADVQRQITRRAKQCTGTEFSAPLAAAYQVRSEIGNGEYEADRHKIQIWTPL